MQHENDHLDGIPAPDRCIDEERPVLNLFAKATAEDAEEILALYRQASRSEFSAWDEEYPGEREINADLSAGKLYCLKDRGQIIGTISVESVNELEELECWEYTDKAVEIARVGVRPDHQGKGISGWMLAELEKRLKAEGYRAVHLLAAKQNLPACRTYRKNGYQHRGMVRMYEIDFLAFEKSLEKE